MRALEQLVGIGKKVVPSGVKGLLKKAFEEPIPKEPAEKKAIKKRIALGDPFAPDDSRDPLNPESIGIVPGGTTGGIGPGGQSSSPFGPIGGGPGSWFRELVNRPSTGGRPVSTAAGPSGSTPTSGGSSSGNPSARDFDIGGGDKPTSTTSPGATTSGGGGGSQTSGPAVQGSPTPGGGSQENERRQSNTEDTQDVSVKYDTPGGTMKPAGKGKYSPTTPAQVPDPTRNPMGLTGNAAIDWAIMRHAIFQAGFVAAPLGPTRAYTPDNSTDYGGGEVSDDLLSLDPNAPLISPAGDYEGRRRYPRNAQRGSMQSPYIEALYPDGSPEYEPPPPDPAEPPPGEPGDPQASIMVKGFSAGVRSASVNLLASGISARSTSAR
jgi:hypothetical protein